MQTNVYDVAIAKMKLTYLYKQYLDIFELHSYTLSLILRDC